MPADPDDTAKLFQALTAGRRGCGSGTAQSCWFQRLAAYHGLIGVLFHSSDPNLARPVVFRYLELEGRQNAMKRHLARILVQLHECRYTCSGPKRTLRRAVICPTRGSNLQRHRSADPSSRLERPLISTCGSSNRDDPPKKPRADKRNIPIQDASGLVFNLDLHWDLFSYTQLLGCADGATSWAWDHATPDPGHPLGPLWHLPLGSGARLPAVRTRSSIIASA